MLPLALLALLAMVPPTNVAGWGPREGVAAWAFDAAGLGAAQGVATAVVYGAMVLVASLPGAVVLVAAWLRRARPPRRPEPLPARIGSPATGGRPGVADRPYTLLSCSMSIDGYIDGAKETRPAALQERPRLRPGRRGARERRRDPGRRHHGPQRQPTPARPLAGPPRRADGRAGSRPSPMKVTVTRRAELDARADFFTTGDAEKLVYCASPRVADARARLEPVATVVDGGDTGGDAQAQRPTSPRAACGDSWSRAAASCTATCSSTTSSTSCSSWSRRSSWGNRGHHTRRVGWFPWTAAHRAKLAETRPIGDVVLLRYALSPRFRDD